MCYVSVSEFRSKVCFYIELSEKEDIYITKNKKTVAILKSPQTNAYENLLSLEGCLARFDDGTSYDDLKAEAILKKWKY